MAITLPDFNPDELAKAIEQEALCVGSQKDPKVRLVLDLPDALELAKMLRALKIKGRI